ncbi:MAG TPA: hypothetical protein VFE51_17815 [Verrucomicrobiae bacterium]|nr:hypothetical protein [Verrucomicrobiae bacterium]
MLTQLSTVKARLGLQPTDPTYDDLLVRVITAVSARFDQETHRTLARSENARFEFPAEACEIVIPCYPIESVTRFELKTSEGAGWIEQPAVDYLIRRNCILSLSSALADLQCATGNLPPALARVTYTGGYLLPDSSTVTGAVPLPADLEQAAIEQTVFWFQTREQVGVVRLWPKGGLYEQFADPDLLPSVRQTLRQHTRLLC